MKIKKLTATFGALDHAALEPGPGLTVITAPNESGKSTWAGFLKAMLYGIDKYFKNAFLNQLSGHLGMSGKLLFTHQLLFDIYFEIIAFFRRKDMVFDIIFSFQRI